jgi:hypothetical protein
MLINRRQSLRGLDHDGNAVILSLIVAKQLYRCPGCRGRIEVGADHILVRYETQDRHEHWHRSCALEMARRELKGVREVTSERAAVSPGARRQAALRRRRREERR